MNFSVSRIVRHLSLLSLVAFLAACKPTEPKESTPTSPSAPPPVATAPATNDASAATTTPAPSADGALTPEDARNHVGEVATVRGKVYRVHVSQKGDTFIDIGGARPNAPFTAVAFAGSIPADQLQQLDGKVISVKGKIKEYQGKVEIVLTSAAQLGE